MGVTIYEAVSGRSFATVRLDDKQYDHLADMICQSFHRYMTVQSEGQLSFRD